MPLDILQLENPILRQTAQEIPLSQLPSQKINDYIAFMKETMHAAPGVGLAGPQVGIPLQIIVIEDREEYFAQMLPEIRKERGRKPVPFHVIINPKLTIIDDEKTLFFEGCLSVKGCVRITPRAKSVRVEYIDENGVDKIIEATGWYARILQHEVDHLKGTLYIDHADKKTQIELTEENRKKWLNASVDEVQRFIYHLQENK